MGYLLIPLIALFGFFALESSAPGAPTRPRLPPPPPKAGPGTGGAPPGGGFNIPPSGNPSVDHEFQLAIAALLASYARTGCPGLDQASVLRFQRALNAYYEGFGQTGPLTADGLYDQDTDGYVTDLIGTSLATCIPAPYAAPAGPGLPPPPPPLPPPPPQYPQTQYQAQFAQYAQYQQQPQQPQQQPQQPQQPQPPQASPYPEPGAPETAAPVGQSYAQGAPPASFSSDLYGTDPSLKSPTSGRLSYAGRT